MASRSPQQYIEAIGRRKTATARVRLTPAKTLTVIVNEKSLEEYFPTDAARATVLRPFEVVGERHTQMYEVSVRVVGSGKSAQAEAVRHGIARALEKAQQTLRPILKEAGLLTRDPRAKERRKFGLKKARKAPQWSKR